MSTPSNAVSSRPRPRASSKVWRYFAARLPCPLVKRAQPRLPSSWAALWTVRSSRSSTGSRLVDWLAALRSALTLSGYASGVVRCFSIRQPSTLSSSVLASRTIGESTGGGQLARRRHERDRLPARRLVARPPPCPAAAGGRAPAPPGADGRRVRRPPPRDRRRGGRAALRAGGRRGDRA